MPSSSDSESGKLYSGMADQVGQTLSGEPSSAIPAEQLALLQQLDEVLRQAFTIMRPVVNRAHESVAAFTLTTISLRLLQDARAIQHLCRNGYADEAQGLSRGMVSGAADLLFISQTDWEARALRYFLFSQKRRRRWSESLVKQGFQARDQHQGWDKTETRKEEELLAGLAEKGLRPAQSFGEANTWTGLRDDQLIKVAGHNDWYDLFYVPFSDAAHSNVISASRQIRQLAQGDVAVGPHYDSRMLQLIVMAAVDTLAAALRQLEDSFGLGKKTDIDSIVTKMGGALKECVAGKERS